METLIWKCDWNQISPSEINECYAARGYRVLTTQTSANCQFNRNQDPQRDYHFLIRIVDCLNMAPRACRRLLAPSGFGFWDVEYLMYMVRSRVYTVSISLALFISFLRPVLCIFSIIERELIYPYFTLLQKRDLYIDSGWRQNFYSLSNSALMSDGMAVPNLCSAGNVTCLDKFVTELTDLYATDYFGLASFVVLVYDHMLTFDDEVEFIWRRKFSKDSLLFLPSESIPHFSGIHCQLGCILRSGVDSCYMSSFCPVWGFDDHDRDNDRCHSDGIACIGIVSWELFCQNFAGIGSPELCRNQLLAFGFWSCC